MNIDKKALIGIITEIEASRDRAKGETRHQSEILKKAKEQHFDTKAIRKVLQRRAMSAGDRESLDIAIETYELAMGSLAAAQEAVDERRMSAREAAEHYGVPRGALAVVTGGSKTGNSSHPPNDADGVITEPQEVEPQGRAGAPSEPSSSAAQAVSPRPPAAGDAGIIDSGEEARSGTHLGISQDDAERSCGQSSATVSEEGDDRVNADTPGPHDAIAEEADWQAFRREEGAPVDNFSTPDSRLAESGQPAGQKANKTAVSPPDSVVQPAPPLDLAHNEVQPSTTPSVGAVGPSSGRVASISGDLEMPPIPEFLRRHREEVRG